MSAMIFEGPWKVWEALEFCEAWKEALHFDVRLSLNISVAKSWEGCCCEI